MALAYFFQVSLLFFQRECERTRFEQSLFKEYRCKTSNICDENTRSTIPSTKCSIPCNKYTIPNDEYTNYAIPIQKYADQSTKYAVPIQKYANQNTKYGIPMKRRQPEHQANIGLRCFVAGQFSSQIYTLLGILFTGLKECFGVKTMTNMRYG